MTGDRGNARPGSRSRKGDKAETEPPFRAAARAVTRPTPPKAKAKSRRSEPPPFLTAKPPTFRRVSNDITRARIKRGIKRLLAASLAAALYMHKASERKDPAPAFPAWRTAAPPAFMPRIDAPPPGPAARAGRARTLKRAMRVMRQAWRELTRMDPAAAEKAAPEPRSARPPKPEAGRYAALKGG